MATKARISATIAFVVWICCGILCVTHNVLWPYDVLLGFVYTFLVATTSEWLVHRYVYHRHEAASQPLVYRNTSTHDAASQPPVYRETSTGSSAQIVQRDKVCNRGTYLVFCCSIGTTLVFLPSWLVAGSHWFTASCLLSLVAFTNLFISVHGTLHRPRAHPWIEDTAWFAFLANHHWIHGIDNACNLNVLLPLFDLLVGTMRFRTTAAEDAKHGPFRAGGKPHEH